LFAYSPEDFVIRTDPRDHGNLDTRLKVCHQPGALANEAWNDILSLPGVERIPKHSGRVSLRVRGVEFAELYGSELWFGAAERIPAKHGQLGEIQRLVEELDRVRSAQAPDREHALYRRAPEAWLESQVRSHIEVVDATLLPEPIYDQVPAFAGGERGILDLRPTSISPFNRWTIGFA
jgi:hypothetical protein